MSRYLKGLILIAFAAAIRFGGQAIIMNHSDEHNIVHVQASKTDPGYISYDASWAKLWEDSQKGTVGGIMNILSLVVVIGIFLWTFAFDAKSESALGSSWALWFLFAAFILLTFWRFVSNHESSSYSSKMCEEQYNARYNPKTVANPGDLDELFPKVETESLESFLKSCK